MNTLTLHGVELTQTTAAELLCLAPGDPAVMSTDDALMAIHQVLVAHHYDVAECENEWVQRYVEDPRYASTRRSCCTIVASRLLAVRP